MGSTTFKHTKRDTPKKDHDNLNHKTPFADRLSLESDYSLKESTQEFIGGHRTLLFPDIMRKPVYHSIIFMK